ncbi:MAG TPA: hypothetical protein VK793_12895 [Steroidobacteraceae bacterium]|nr:hypothetical protein [Steroidobacteraceae bacterium]
MINLVESAGRVAARIGAFGAGFDPEVLSLPGGSFIAVLLWLYAATAANLHRPAPPGMAPPRPAPPPRAMAPRVVAPPRAVAPPLAAPRPCCCGHD